MNLSQELPEPEHHHPDVEGGASNQRQGIAEAQSITISTDSLPNSQVYLSEYAYACPFRGGPNGPCLNEFLTDEVRFTFSFV